MITQTFKNGESTIRTENAESLEDARTNGFAEGVYSRFFINDKPVQNYMAMVRHIIDETKRTGQRFIPPTAEALKALQKEVIQKQNDEMRSQYLKLQAQYKQMGAPEALLKQLDDTIDKIDLCGVRVVR